MNLRKFGNNNIYEDIADKYRRFIKLGVLKAGDKLSSCRNLAIEMGVNPNTVARAYSELEKEGLIISYPKKGLFVCEVEGDGRLYEARERIKELKAAGITRDELIKLIEEAYGDRD